LYNYFRNLFQKNRFLLSKMELCRRTTSNAKVVPGFVVNVHDAINFDIDLTLTTQQLHRFSRVIHNEYQYKEESGDCKVGRAFRCRLKGIQLSNSYAHRNKSRSQTMMSKATKTMKRMIDRSNGWIICVVSEVDVYNRLLVDLIDPGLFPEKYVSYRDILLSQYSKLFSKYVPYHESSSERHAQRQRQHLPPVSSIRDYFSR